MVLIEANKLHDFIEILLKKLGRAIVPGRGYDVPSRAPKYRPKVFRKYLLPDTSTGGGHRNSKLWHPFTIIMYKMTPIAVVKNCLHIQQRIVLS